MIRNLLFSIFFFVGIIIISIIFLPALLLPRKITLIGGKLMGYWAEFCLRIFLSVKIIIKGKENIVTDQKFLLLPPTSLCLKHFTYKLFSIHQYLF